MTANYKRPAFTTTNNPSKYIPNNYQLQDL